MGNFISLILIITSIGIFFGYIDPLYTKTGEEKPGIKELRAQVSEYNEAQNKSNVLKAKREDLTKKFNAFTDTERSLLQKMLPDSIDNIRLIIDINEIAKGFGMNIRGFKTDALTAESGDKKAIGKDTTPNGVLTLSFSTTATYDKFIEFLNALQSSLRILDVTSIQFSAGNETGVYDYSVTLKTYWLK